MPALNRKILPGSEEQLLFLGVMRSARGLAWYDRLAASTASLATAISQRHNLPELLGRVLAARGANLENIDTYLNPSLKALMPDPSTLRDMDRGADRIAKAILENEPVAIFGDYDVDGAASSALLKKLFSVHDHEARIYIPDRIFEGYGPNRTAIEALIDDGASLIITVDCGTTSHKALGAARERNVDVVIVDHHQADQELPEAHAIINPNRQDDLSGQGHLAAAGVVFLLLVAVVRILRSQGWYGNGREEPDLLRWLDMVGLATVCDVVSLTGLNRAYVSQGLKIMRMRSNIGLRALADAAGLSAPPTAYHCGFVLGPRINAGGRIGKASLGAELLSCEDEFEAEQIAKTLDELNRERKAMEAAFLEEALIQAENKLETDPEFPILIAGSPDWHKGLIGLVAARLTERFRRPSLVFSWNEKTEEGTGSARSISGVDIGAAVRAAVDKGILAKGGGHAMAAGMTVERSQLEEFEAFLVSKLKDEIQIARMKSGLQIDGSLMPLSVTNNLMDLLDKAGPFGMGNPTPRFVFPAHRISFAKIVGENHVRCSLAASDNSKIDAIAFRATDSELGELLLNSSGRPLHVAGQLRRDHWGGREKFELVINDVADPAKQK